MGSLFERLATMNPEVLAAIIQSIGTVLAATIAAIAAALVGKHFASRTMLRNKLREALHDIDFLLEVERLHCERHTDAHGESFKQRVRDEARTLGKIWSGENTPGRAQRFLRD